MDMFKLMERAKLLEIEGPRDKRKVTVTMANEKKYQLKKEKTKIYRESDKDHWRNFAEKG